MQEHGEAGVADGAGRLSPLHHGHQGREEQGSGLHCSQVMCEHVMSSVLSDNSQEI